MYKLWSSDLSVSLHLAFEICSLHITDYMQESSLCEAHNPFSQLSSRQVTSGHNAGKPLPPHSRALVHSMLTSRRPFTLALRQGQGHPRWIPDPSVRTSPSHNLPFITQCHSPHKDMVMKCRGGWGGAQPWNPDCPGPENLEAQWWAHGLWVLFPPLSVGLRLSIIFT